MKLRRLQLKHFRQHADSEIHFQDGITGVLGSNGAGKSTVLEGVAYALYGADAIRGTKGTIRWDRAPARRVAEVTLDFELEGQAYSLTRSETNARLQVAGRGIIADGTSAVNGFVPQLLGMGWKEFASSHLTSQKDLARIASMGPTERQAFYRSVMGVERVDQALAAARKEKGELTQRRDGMRQMLGERLPLRVEVDASAAAVAQATDVAISAAALFESAEHMVAAARDVAEAHAEMRTEHARISTELERAESAMRDTASAIEQCTARLRSAQEAANRVEANASSIDQLDHRRKERDALLQLQATAGTVAELRADADSLKTSIDGWRAEIERLRPTAAYEETAAEAAAALRDNLERQLSDLRTNRRDAHTRAQAEAEAATKARAREQRKLTAIRDAGAAGACPTCSRALGEQFAEVVAGIEQEIAALAAQVERTEAQIAAAGAAPAAEQDLEAQYRQAVAAVEGHARAKVQSERATELITSLEQQIASAIRRDAELRARLDAMPAANVADVQAELARVDAEIQRLQTIATKVIADRGLASHVPALEAEREGLIRTNGEVSARAARLAGDAQVLDYSESAHRDAEATLRGAEAKREGARVDLARAEGAVAAAEARHSRAVQALDAFDLRAAELREAEAQLQITSAAAERLAEFRVAVASGIRPEMEELVSGFVGLLTDGRYEAVTISEDFACTLHRDGVPVEVISGGEEDVVAVAMRLATSQMIAERAGHPLSLLILDEVFGSLDEVRRANALALFRRLRGVFPQILLISHIPESQHQVDHVCLIEFDATRGCSVVRDGRAESAVPAQLAEVA